MNRIDRIKELERLRGGRVLVYVTGDRRGLETKIASEVLDLFIAHLDALGDIPKLCLYLYTRGGDTLAAWSVANLLRQFCDSLEIIVPSKAHSAGTLICLAADTIVMTKQATLGPIDPSVNTPLNPSVPGAPQTVKAPVSVEDIGGFVEFAQSVARSEESKTQALGILAQSVNPLVLGNAFRARTQIRMLAKKLLSKRSTPPENAEKLLQFLCSESGSHDYTIDRREAREELGLPVEKPNDELYGVVKGLYDDIAADMQLSVPFDPGSLLGGTPSVKYSFNRALLQSVPGGRDTFVTEGQLVRQQLPGQQGNQVAIQDVRIFEGWRHSNA